jgi:(E)-4-hydroxy-3-methylbut-2-enyl-diphosphate synthase
MRRSPSVDDKTDTRDVRATVQQIWSLEAAGCEIVPLCRAGARSSRATGRNQKIRIPLVADIHLITNWR